jgi:hypothetical protein
MSLEMKKALSSNQGKGFRVSNVYLSILPDDMDTYDYIATLGWGSTLKATRRFHLVQWNFLVLSESDAKRNAPGDGHNPLRHLTHDHLRDSSLATRQRGSWAAQG